VVVFALSETLVVAQLQVPRLAPSQEPTAFQKGGWVYTLIELKPHEIELNFC